jgi:subtilisin family serine protease
MVTRALISMIVAGALLAATAAAAEAQAAPGPPSPYVVVFRDSVTDSGTATSYLASRLAFATSFRYGSALKGFAANLTAGQLALLQADPDVEFVQPDVTFSAAGVQSLAAGETEPVGIRRIGAATTTTVHTSSGVNIAELDTGIDLTNPDLNAVSGANCIKSGAPAQDDNGHGTNVAGIMAAKDQGVVHTTPAGVVGVAPGTRLYAVKVLNRSGTGTLSEILCGINWVTANAAALNIKVANMSLAGSGSAGTNCGNSNGDAEHLAICRSVAAGVTYVAAAGNGATNFAGTVPAAYPEVLTVTAMTDTNGTPGGLGPAACIKGQSDDTYATYSNYAVSAADQAHTIAAPGTCVVSDALGGGTSTYYGTSQAAPHVAATVALCINDGGTPGPCSGLSPANVIAQVTAEAHSAATPQNGPFDPDGFLGDPLQLMTGKYFGYLVDASGY